ncbi:hypothetical protein FRC03_002000 [Tulasnella sp. 419]|nr:hypothetical protein FRC03_002000 [Tulasnella sp. 419]
MSVSSSTSLTHLIEDGDPESPTSAALAALNMTRDDLARHTRQMRSFLSTSAPSLHVLSQNAIDSSSGQRASLDAVLDRSDSRKTRREKRDSSSLLQDASSQCSSIAYQQDVFYSRPGSVAPSSSHPSLRRSQSLASHVSSEFDPDDLEVASLNAPSSQLYSRASSSFSNIGSLRTDASYSRPSPHPSTSTSATAATANLAQYENAVTPVKSSSRYPQIDLGSSPKFEDYDDEDPPSSPKFGLPPPTSSPVDPRTPFRHHHHLSHSRHPPNSLSSPVHPSSSPQTGDHSPTNMPFKLPPGPRLTSKPHYSYAALIGQALMAAHEKRLSLNQIYTWISMAYPYFKRGEAGWQNSIRHNLSLNGCFVKIKRDDGEKGKGSWWAIREGDEMCFAGGGFQRQGRAGGRKRKGKADSGKPGAEDIDGVATGHQSRSVSPIKPAAVAGEGADSADEAGASPKKKKKTMISKAAAASKAQHGAAIPMTTPNSHNAAYANAATFYTMAYPAAAMGVPPRQHPLAHLVPPYVANMYDHQPPAVPAATASAPAVHVPTQQEPPKRATTTHVRMHANTSGYLFQPLDNFSSSPAAISQAQLAGRGGGEKELETDRVAVTTDAETGTMTGRENFGQGLEEDQAMPHEEEEDGTGLHDRVGTVLGANNTLAESPLAARTTVPVAPLGKPITLAGDNEGSNTNSAPVILQPGFTFTPSSAKASRTEVEKVKTEDDDGIDAHDDMDDQHFFSSSPVPARRPQRPNPLYRGASHISTHKRTNNRSSMMNPGTDLLSRVLDSKAANKKNKKEPSAASSHQYTFPRPTTPVRDERPSTPPPKRPTVNVQVQEDNADEAQGPNPEQTSTVEKADPTFVAAVALASLSPMRTPVSHAAYHMSPVAPPSSDLLHYKHNLGPPVSPFRTPKTSSPTKESSVKGGFRGFDYYDYMGGGESADDFMVSSTPGRSTVGLAALLKTPATPIGGGGGGLFGSSSLYQSPSLPSPGWRRY